MARIWSTGFGKPETVRILSLNLEREDKTMDVSAWMKRQDELVKLIKLDDRYQQVLEKILADVAR